MYTNNEILVIDSVVANLKNSTILIQKRSPNRKLFPNCWEFLGGHLENNESVEDCIRRELFEEGNLRLNKIITKLYEFSWENKGNNVRDIVYLVLADGIFKPEKGKITTHRWITKKDIDLLLNDNPESKFIHESAIKAFGMLTHLKNFA